MAQPPRYDRDFDFTEWATSRPQEPLPGDRVDSELDNVALALGATQDNLGLIQRDDGELGNATVGQDQLKPGLIPYLEEALDTVGPQGPPAPQLPGPPGVVGPAGAPMPWITGTGIPPYTIGIAGQLYLNVDNGDVYERSDVAWLLTGNIRGPAGTGGGTGVSDHGALTGLMDPDHPIAAVQGLRSELDALSAGIGASVAGQVRTYSQPQAPTGGLNAGDLWINTALQNRLYRWNGVSWADVTDARIADTAAAAASAITAAAGAQATADGKVTTFFASQQPTATGVGDLWIDQASNNQLKRWSGTSWLLVRDAGITQAINAASNAQTTADGKIVTFYQTNQPTGGKVGDLWFDTDDQNHLYRHNGATWVSARDAAIAAAALTASQALTKAASAEATADGKIEVYFAASAPVANGVGDLWIRTSDNQLHRWSGSQWTSVQDAGISGAFSAAALAQDAADGKIVTFYATTPPVPEGVGDLWIDTDDANRPYRWNGSNWIDITPIADVVGGQVGVKGLAPGAVMQMKFYELFSTSISIAASSASPVLMVNNSNLDFVIGQAADGTSPQQFLVEVTVGISQATWNPFTESTILPDGPPPRFRVQLWNVTDNVQVASADTFPLRVRNTQSPGIPNGYPIPGTRYEMISFTELLSVASIPASPKTYRVRLLGYTDQNLSEIQSLNAWSPALTVNRLRR
jgi:hypothetical protein